MIVLLFDNETTGLISNHKVRLSEQPEVIEFYGVLADLADNGKIIREVEHLIKPSKPLPDKPPPGEKKTITEITGITNEMLEGKPAFSEVADEIFAFLESAPAVAAHNVSFDQEMLDIEADRLGRKIKWPRAICTIEATTFIKGGRLNLTKLHEYLFGEGFKDAHRAKNDTLAQLRCAVELFKRGYI